MIARRTESQTENCKNTFGLSLATCLFRIVMPLIDFGKPQVYSLLFAKFLCAWEREIHSAAPAGSDRRHYFGHRLANMANLALRRIADVNKYCCADF